MVWVVKRTVSMRRFFRLGLFFGVQNFEFQYFFEFSERYQDFVDIFGGHHKIGQYLGVISMHFRVFS